MNHLLTGRYFHSNVQFSNMRLKNLHVKNIRLNLKRIHVFCSVKKRRFLSFCSYFVRNLLANSAVERTLNSIYSIHSTDNNIPGRDYSLKFIARIYIWTPKTNIYDAMITILQWMLEMIWNQTKSHTTSNSHSNDCVVFEKKKSHFGWIMNWYMYS